MTRDMKPMNKKLNNLGLTIIEVLVAIGIMSIMLVGFSSMMFSQNKEVKAVGEILAIQDLQKTLSSAISDVDLCNYTLGITGASSTVVFDARQLPVSINFNGPIYSGIRIVSGATPILGPAIVQKGQAVSPYSSSIVVDSIRLEIQAGSRDNYVGRWIVDFDKSKTVRAHKAAFATTLLKVDDTNPATAVISGCNGIVDSKLSDKNCPVGQVLSGFTADGEINCYNPFIGGDCASGSIVIGVNSNGTVNCRSPLPTGGSCAPGDYVSGISPTGVPYCETMAQAPVDCSGAFGACSATCGGGVQSFQVLRPKFGTGADCSYPNGYSQACNTQACSKTRVANTAICIDHFGWYQFRKNGNNLELVQWGTGPGGDVGRNCGTGPQVVVSIPLTNPGATPVVSLSGTSSGGGCNTSNISFSGYGAYRTNTACTARGAQTLNSSLTVTYTD